MPVSVNNTRHVLHAFYALIGAYDQAVFLGGGRFPPRFFFTGLRGFAGFGSFLSGSVLRKRMIISVTFLGWPALQHHIDTVVGCTQTAIDLAFRSQPARLAIAVFANRAFEMVKHQYQTFFSNRIASPWIGGISSGFGGLTACARTLAR